MPTEVTNTNKDTKVTKRHNTSQFSKYKRKPVSINTSEPLEYNSYGWEEDDYCRPFTQSDKEHAQYFNRDHNKEFMIFNFGVTIEGHSVCTQICGYKPYFYVMIPQDFNDQQRADLLEALHTDTVIEIDNDVEKNQITDKDRFYSQFYKSAIIQDRVEIVSREIFWKFTNHAKFDFIQLVFHSKAAMKFYYRVLSKPIDLNITGLYHKCTKYNLFEADMEPLLRYYHDQKLKPSGWIRLESDTYSVVSRVARTQIAVKTSHQNLMPIEKDAIAPLRVAAFDIECDSSHGDFPVAQKDCKKLAMQLVMAWFRDKKILSTLSPNDPRYASAQTQISMGASFFANRIKKAVQLDAYINNVNDSDIDTIYLRGCYNDTYQSVMRQKCQSPAFEAMVQEIYFICNRELVKIIAKKNVKKAMKAVENIEKRHLERLRPGQTFSIRNYIEIIQRVAKEHKLTPLHILEQKMVDKNQLVRFVNNQINRFFGKPYGDRCIQIGTVFWQFGEEAPYHNNILTLQDCEPFKVGNDDCDIREFCYKHEATANQAEVKLLLAWSKLIRDYDPDIITGYNIHGFDMAFMYDRVLDIICDIRGSGSTSELTWDEQQKIRTNPKYQDFISLGKLDPDIVKRCPNMRGRLINKKLSSSALGDNFLFYFNTPGRVQIDLLKVCQNSMAKLPSYKLDDVASYYISGKITHILPDDLDINKVISEWIAPGGPRDKFLSGDGEDQKQAFSDYLSSYIHSVADSTNMKEGTRLMVKGTKEIDDGNYVVVNMSTTGQQLYDGNKIAVTDIQRKAATIPLLQKDGSEKIATLETICLEKPVPLDSLPSQPMWGLAKDDVSPKDIFQLQKGDDSGRAVVAKYCIQDCVLLIRLLKKLEVITNNFGMSNVSLIPFSYIFLRGQGIKIFSLVVNECSLAGFLLPTLEKVYPDEEELSEGAHVMVTRGSSKFNNIGDDDSDEERPGMLEEGNEQFQLKSDFNVIPMTDDGYEGAIVLVPKPGIYFEPVTVLDFSSLYPSEMIASDLSHDRIVEDECWLGDKGKARLHELGYDVLDVTYDNLVLVDSKNKGKGKRKDGTRTVRFVQPHSGEKGLIPRILQKLLGARKATKKLMKKESDPFRYTLLDGLQLAYKLTANSLYGQIGARTSKVYKQEIAASTTAGGRRNIYLAKDYCLAKNPGCDVIYGDSVTGDTPIILKNRGKVEIKSICDYYKNKKWVSYKSFKPLQKDLHDKYMINLTDDDVKVYVKNKWIKVKKIIKHKTNKKIYRVLTHTGCVDVTEDHSLISSSGAMIKPEDCEINSTEIMQSYPKFTSKRYCKKLVDMVADIRHINNKILTDRKKECFIYGLFFGDGSCNVYDTKWGRKYSWAINNKDMSILNTAKKMCDNLNIQDTTFKILNTMKSSGVNKLVPSGSIKNTVKKFIECYDDRRYKIIPNHILNDKIENIYYFILGYYAADGYKCDNAKVKNIRFSNKGKIGSSQLYYLFKKLGYYVSINTRKDKPDIYDIKCCVGKCSKTKQRNKPNIIKKVDFMRNIQDEYVYDIETSCGWFSAGIGDITLKNTDSVFVKLNLSYKLDPPPETTDPAGREYPETKLEKIKRSLEIGLWLQAKLKEDKVFKAPHDLEYEKVYYPLILITKKRYIGIKFEFDPEDGKKTSMGVVTKRRDNAPILKHTFIGVVDTLMKERNLAKAVKFVQDTCRAMIEKKFDLNMFVISKTLREYYKDPESIAHKVLAMRMGERDPGNKPSSNSRIPYVYVKINEKPGIKYLQGDRIEHVNYVRENKCPVDYETYIKNQIMKPVSQIFELVVDQLPGYPYPGDNGDHFLNLENIYYNKYKGDLKKTAKKVSELKQKIIHKIIFSDLITYAINTHTGQKTIANFFGGSDIPTSNSKITEITEIDNDASGADTANTDNETIDTKSKSKPKKKIDIVKKEKQQKLDSFFKA